MQKEKSRSGRRKGAAVVSALLLSALAVPGLFGVLTGCSGTGDTADASVSEYMKPAGSYREVYESIQEASSYNEEYVLEEYATTGDAAPKASAGIAADIGGTDHSTTNTREEGVQESDRLITDGSHLFLCEGSEAVRIISASENGKMKELSRVKPDLGYSGEIKAMYYADDQLVLIESIYEPTLKEENKTLTLDDTDQVRIETYDAADKSAVTLKDSVTVEGSYRTSRMKDGNVYLMTTFGTPYIYYYDYVYPDDVIIEDAEVPEESSGSTDSASAAAIGFEGMPEMRASEESSSDGYDEQEFLESGSLPKIDGSVPSTGDIYIPETPSGSMTLTMTSVSTEQPGDVKDSMVILSCPDPEYVSSDAVYLASSSYTDSSYVTNHVRIDLKDGSFVPAGVGTVPGDIEDSFSIDEDEDGYLRVATTSWGTELENGIYIFDPSMKEVGSLTGIAPGEEIKSARYLDDICYLVTYEQTDPLFAIDLSDPAKPELIGSLKVPGFSDYLHLWSDNRLLGIGYTTDKYNATENVKMTMFDISDPADLQEEATLVLEDVEDTNALSDYTALLISPDKNLIGFSTSPEYTGPESDSCAYSVFRYADGKFSRILNYEMKGSSYADYTGARAVYIGDNLYVSDESGTVTSFRIQDDSCKKITTLKNS